MRILFFGTPSFSARALDYLMIEGKSVGIEVCGVVSKPDKPKGRSREPVPTPVKELLLKKYPHIPFWQPEKVSDGSLFPTLEALEVDFFVVVAYGEILKESLLLIPRIASINLHTSLLPKLRGAAPIQRAILNGEVESGLSIMYMAKKMDAGDIISQSTVPIPQEMTYGELEEALLKQGLPELVRSLKALYEGSASRQIQDESQVTFAPKVELDECEIRWDKPAQELHNLVRGVNPEPGAWCWVLVKGEKKRLKIFRTVVHTVDNLDSKPADMVSYGPGGYKIRCLDGILELLDVQLEGKKRMPIADLMRGMEKTQFLL